MKWYLYEPGFTFGMLKDQTPSFSTGTTGCPQGIMSPVRLTVLAFGA